MHENCFQYGCKTVAMSLPEGPEVFKYIKDNQKIVNSKLK